MSFAFGFSSVGSRTLPAAGGAVFDPAVQSLAWWWRGSYGGVPWVGTASAGTSGSRDLTEATTPMSVGAALDGFTPADGDGTNDQLLNGTAWSTLATVSAYEYLVAFKARTAVSTNALNAAYDNRQLICDSGGFIGAALATIGGIPKVQAWHFDSAAKGVELTIALNVWNLLMVRYDGTNIRAQLNGGAVQTAAASNVGSLAGTFKMGTRYTGGVFADALIIDTLGRAAAGADADFTDYRAYIQNRYPSSGGF